MKKKVKYTKFDSLDISNVSLLHDECWIGSDPKNIEKWVNAMGYDPVVKKTDDRKILKEKIIENLQKCDDFSITYSEDSYMGNSAEIDFYKVEIESEEDFKIRKEKAYLDSKNAKEKAKIIKEENERLEYERLKNKFEKNN